MRFLFAVIDDRSNSASKDEMAAIDAFNDKIESAGQRVLAAGLVAPSDAILIDNRNGHKSIETGTRAITTDYMAGFWIIEAPSDEVATELAFEASASCNRRIEVRRFL